MTDSYVPSNLLWTCVTFVPLSAIVVMFLINKNAVDLLINCLTSKESELWHSLGEAWYVPRE